MVNELDISTSRRPGPAFWLRSLVVLPPIGVALTAWILLSQDADNAAVWFICAVAVATLGALGVGGLPRIARLRGRAHAAWSAAGAAIVLAVTAGEFGLLYLEVMHIACEAGGNCL